MLLILSTLIWVRTLIGWVVLPTIGLTLLYLSWESIAWLQVFTVQFLGVQACISSYKQLDYLFSSHATINGRTMLSDTGNIAKMLILPHWFWGALLSALAFLLLFESLQFACRQEDFQT